MTSRSIHLGEKEMRRKYVSGATMSNPHAMDFFVWRRGSWKGGEKKTTISISNAILSIDVEIPKFLIGR